MADSGHENGINSEGTETRKLGYPRTSDGVTNYNVWDEYTRNVPKKSG